MKTKTFKIIYSLDKETLDTECSIYSLHKYIDKLLKDGSKVICILEKPVKTKKNLDNDAKEKNKYYNSKYNCYYKQFKSNKISELTFEKIKNKLKELKKQCLTLKDFTTKFELFENEELKRG